MGVNDFRNSQKETEVTTKDIWHTTFMGVVAIQAWQDLMLWERFLNTYKPRSIIELGTFTGGMSVYLKMQADARFARFYTLDWQKYDELHLDTYPTSIIANHFIHADLLLDDGKVVRDLLATQDIRPVALFCDNGNKPLEMQLFSKMLKPGDLMITHDWMNEIGDADIAGLPIEMIMREECESLQSLTRFFVVK